MCKSILFSLHRNPSRATLWRIEMSLLFHGHQSMMFRSDCWVFDGWMFRFPPLCTAPSRKMQNNTSIKKCTLFCLLSFFCAVLSCWLFSFSSSCAAKNMYPTEAWPTMPLLLVEVVGKTLKEEYLSSSRKTCTFAVENMWVTTKKAPQKASRNRAGRGLLNESYFFSVSTNSCAVYNGS